MRAAGKRRACLAAALIAAAPAILTAQAEIMTISNPKVFKTPTRPPVSFTHMSHMTKEGLDCLSCHHRYEKGSAQRGKNVLDMSALSEGNPAVACASCHAGKADLMKAFHRLCIGCHDATRRQGGVTGPRVCGECHVWGK